MKLITFIYTALIIYFIIERKFDFLLYTAISLPFAILLIRLNFSLSIKKYKKLIKKAEENIKNNVEVLPFLPVNHVKWQIIELIPGVSRAAAKMTANRAGKQKFKDFTEFANFTKLEEYAYPLCKKILKF